MALNTLQRPSLEVTASSRATVSNGQQALLNEQVTAIDLNTALTHRADEPSPQQAAFAELENRFDSIIDNERITNQQFDVITDFVNQQHIDPMMGFDHGAMDQIMNQFAKMQQLIKDQVVHNYSGTWTHGTGPNGNWEHYERGTQSVTTYYNPDGSVKAVKDEFNGTCKDGKWQDLNPDQCDDSENEIQGEGRLPQNDNQSSNNNSSSSSNENESNNSSGNENQSSNGGQNNNQNNNDEDGNSIIAETEWPMGYGLSDFANNHGLSEFNQGLDIQSIQPMQQAQFFNAFL